MRTRLVTLILIFLALASCTPYGHWGSYGWWRDNCPGFPSYEQVEQVLADHQVLIEELKEDKLIHSVYITQCPDGAFITLFYITSKAQVLEALDEVGARAEGLTMFYGIPFRFLRD